MIRSLILVLALFLVTAGASSAQTLDASRFRIEWQVVNRFRLFRDAQFFKQHENAWRQYLLHVAGQKMSSEERDRFVARTSVLGSEHVLNDRFIAFTRIVRETFDWRGWAAKGDDATCYDRERRDHSACGGVDSYLNPDRHAIELWLTGVAGAALPKDARCEWHIDGRLVATAACTERVSGKGITLPYPMGGEIAVNVVGEQPIIVDAKVRDLLIAGLGDSFASGEGNPNLPVAFAGTKRHRNLYPLRQRDDASGSATWSDQLCHRSLYGQHLRAALQVAIEHPQIAVTFLDYSCSGAGVDEGILGPQVYVERVADRDVSSKPAARPLSGGAKDSQLYRILRELCKDKPEIRKGQLVCPGQNYRRNLDFVFLSVGGNDIGFASIVAWASLRDGASSSIADFFGATISAKEFARRMRAVLPDAYARLASAFEAALPLTSADDGVFDPSRVVLTAYPDLVSDESGALCAAATSDREQEDRYPANQSLDMFTSWLTARASRLKAVHEQFGILYRRMGDLAGDHGWTFADQVYDAKMFEGHGFCAQNLRRISDPAEVLMIPCWGHSERDTQTCQSNWTGNDGRWRPYNPANQNYPYALRQRWVRSFNDAYMVVNQKVVDRWGKIDERTSAAVFSETTGALHPTAEGHAAMADGLMLSIRPVIYEMLYGDQ